MVSKFSLSFNKSLARYLTVVLGLLIGVFIYFQYAREKTYKVELLNSELQSFNYQLFSFIQENENIEEFVLKHKPQNVEELRVTVIDTNGVVLIDTYIEKENALDSRLNMPEVKAALRDGSSYELKRQSSATQEYYFYSASHIGTYIIRTAIPYGDSLQQILRADAYFFWIMGIYILLVGLIVYIITKRVGADLLQLKNEERSILKKELTHNISHELKTPVSSIRGYLETIMVNENLSDEQIRTFISRSYDQTTRLSNLLKDMSTITRMDEYFDKIEKERVSLSDMVKEVVQDEQLSATDKGITIYNELPDDIYVYGNPSLIYSIFYNLIDNSVAYSGGDSIVIKLYDSQEEGKRKPTIRRKISFSDNGVGIADEHLSRIFERFYRVDKGRSRKMGGTGLGLSIVKNAVIIHGGTISARNKEEGGLEFVFTL